MDNLIKEKLELYVDLICRWNLKLNLISYKTVKEIWNRHINDSLQILDFINDKNIHLIDIGSGAGLPGVILSIGGIKEVTLVESNTKKAAFLLQASKFSDNKINVLNEKVELLKLKGDILTARGFADLNKIFDLTSQYEIKDKYLLLKGVQFNQEIQNLKNKWNLRYKVYQSKTSESGKILEITKI